MAEDTIRYGIRWVVAGAFLVAALGIACLNFVWFVQSRKHKNRRGPSTVPVVVPILALGAAIAVPDGQARMFPVVVALLDVGTLGLLYGLWKTRHG